MTLLFLTIYISKRKFFGKDLYFPFFQNGIPIQGFPDYVYLFTAINFNGLKPKNLQLSCIGSCKKKFIPEIDIRMVDGKQEVSFILDPQKHDDCVCIVEKKIVPNILNLKIGKNLHFSTQMKEIFEKNTKFSLRQLKNNKNNTNINNSNTNNNDNNDIIKIISNNNLDKNRNKIVLDTEFTPNNAISSDEWSDLLSLYQINKNTVFDLNPTQFYFLVSHPNNLIALREVKHLFIKVEKSFPIGNTSIFFYDGDNNEIKHNYLCVGVLKNFSYAKIHHLLSSFKLHVNIMPNIDWELEIISCEASFFDLHSACKKIFTTASLIYYNISESFEGIFRGLMNEEKIEMAIDFLKKESNGKEKIIETFKEIFINDEEMISIPSEIINRIKKLESLGIKNWDWNGYNIETPFSLKKSLKSFMQELIDLFISQHKNSNINIQHMTNEMTKQPFFQKIISKVVKNYDITKKEMIKFIQTGKVDKNDIDPEYFNDVKIIFFHYKILYFHNLG